MPDVKRKPEITEEDIWKEPVVAFLITKIPYYAQGSNGREPSTLSTAIRSPSIGKEPPQMIRELSWRRKKEYSG
ncbi:hypothetical protein [Desulfofundulus sp.]|uniref:hypothetical protein n=1 Tax=Desulfofundulus sp. TaxID=2282750 RepID=UPI003C719AFF